MYKIGTLFCFHNLHFNACIFHLKSLYNQCRTGSNVTESYFEVPLYVFNSHHSLSNGKWTISLESLSFGIWISTRSLVKFWKLYLSYYLTASNSVGCTCSSLHTVPRTTQQVFSCSVRRSSCRYKENSWDPEQFYMVAITISESDEFIDFFFPWKGESGCRAPGQLCFMC